ncbi:MAG: hypothetical protein K2O91_16310 [Lachnospiraceae bacterium]|nr:hypothetical protein [Lachnospiraceae bacterium]
MKKPVIDEGKLPEVMKIIDDANTLMTEKDCEEDKAAREELEELQSKLRELTGNQQIQIRDFWRYDEAVSLRTAARGALMSPPEKEDLTDEQIKEIVLDILKHDEAEMDWWLNYLKVNTGLDNLTDYIFYPNLIGLDGGASLEQIADKIIADRK